MFSHFHAIIYVVNASTVVSFNHLILWSRRQVQELHTVNYTSCLSFTYARKCHLWSWGLNRSQISRFVHSDVLISILWNVGDTNPATQLNFPGDTFLQQHGCQIRKYRILFKAVASEISSREPIKIKNVCGSHFTQLLHVFTNASLIIIPGLSFIH